MKGAEGPANVVQRSRQWRQRADRLKKKKKDPECQKILKPVYSQGVRRKNQYDSSGVAFAFMEFREKEYNRGENSGWDERNGKINE